MSETKRALSVGQTESARMECAGARIEGERNSNPQQVLYQEKSPLSTLYEKKVENDGTFISEYRCAWCGKVFIPTSPEYAWDDCCSYTCCLRYDEKIKQEGLSEKVVMMSAYDKRELMLFECAQDAADYLGVRRESVRDACNGRTKTCKGYAFRWAEKGKTDIERTARKYTRSDRRKNHSITVHVERNTLDKIESMAYDHNVRRSKMITAIIKEGSKPIEKEDGYEDF